MIRTLKNYIFWTYERGSFHYDVMVTLILIFLFLSPRLWNYGDHPAAGSISPREVLVKAESNGSIVYQLPAERVHSTSSSVSEAELAEAIQPISGPMVIDRYVPLRDASGKVTAYKVWAHR